MIAYVHIGTEKTGTTSIQTFLRNNKDLLQKQRVVYSSSLGNNGSQWNFTFLAYNDIRSDEYCISRKIYTKYDFKNHKKKIFFDLKKELREASHQKLIISSEHLSSRLYDIQELKKCKKILQYLGFQKIIVMVYLRENGNMAISSYSTKIKSGKQDFGLKPCKEFEYLGNYKELLCRWQEIFSKENIIVRLFDKNEFYQGDLLKDFVHSIGLKWDNEFVIPPKQNESLDLIGVELLKRINQYLPWRIDNKINHLRGGVTKFITKYFQNSNNSHLKFQPPKEVVQSYIDYFEESNEWVRKEFFPHKERLFPKKDLSNYKENYELKEMKPEYWDRIAEFIADIVKTKTQLVANQTTQIQNLSNALNQTIKEKDNIINSNTNHINQLQSNIQEKSTQLNQTQSKLSFQTKYGTAKQRIQNQLSYKLGQAMIVNSKSVLGYIRMPFVLSYIKDKHKQEQKIYQEKIKKDPSLKLPPLESYPDYKEALKLKNHLSYKLGEALIQANKTWYGGGVSQTAI
ncbi:hypothetical protein O8I42_02745 [Campylobacter lari]|uniref:hypothetical protein n=1 Tax=Campylobacter lari TaxID=201 RepID=UPI00372A20E7